MKNSSVPYIFILIMLAYFAFCVVLLAVFRTPEFFILPLWIIAFLFWVVPSAETSDYVLDGLLNGGDQ